jgi:hypothetical protein
MGTCCTTHKQKITRAKVIQITAIAAIGRENRPQCHGPRTNRSGHIRRLAIGIP